MGESNEVVQQQQRQQQSHIDEPDNGSPPFQTKKIFVGGLPHSTTDFELKSYFEAFGAITDSKVMTDRETGRSRGFGFVSFNSESAVDTVMSQQHEFGGRQVELKRAEPKRPLQASFSGRDKPARGTYIYILLLLFYHT